MKQQQNPDQWIYGKCNFNIMRQSAKGTNVLTGYIALSNNDGTYQDETYSFISFSKRVTEQVLYFTNGITGDATKNKLQWKDIYLFGRWEENTYQNQTKLQFKAEDMIVVGYDMIHDKVKAKFDALENKAQDETSLNLNIIAQNETIAQLKTVYPQAPTNPFNEGGI